MSKLQAVHTVKESIVERKFTEGESEEVINTWTKEFDGFLKEADERALTLRQLVEKMEEEKRLADKMESDKKENALAKAKPQGAHTIGCVADCYCVRGTRTQPLICVVREVFSRLHFRRRRHTFASL